MTGVGSVQRVTVKESSTFSSQSPCKESQTVVEANTLGSLLALFSHSTPLKSQGVTCSKLIMVANA